MRGLPSRGFSPLEPSPKGVALWNHLRRSYAGRCPGFCANGEDDEYGTIFEAMITCAPNNNTALGYGNYEKKAGNTEIWGYDIQFGVSNTARPATYRHITARAIG